MSAKIRRYNFIKVLGEGQVDRSFFIRWIFDKKQKFLLISMLLFIKQKIRKQMKMLLLKKLKSAVDKKRPMALI